MDFPDDILYTKEHEWVRIENGKARIGITDYAQKELGDIVFVELPEVGSEVTAMEPLGVVESVKTVSDIYSPVSGKVLEINDELESIPELVNSSPYEKGWMIVVKMNDKEELKELLSAEMYTKYVEEEIQ
ncbi:MAG: glycine cleavage system protein H [Nitrospinae bacterium RIFCSPLOWO2_02_FULL_39_110]|nr:MAG: glycine cleavage system protein H [Nitrospinae bacterium RIFCSPHIGHO2_02_39_11]OGV98783.1 MAG: glycine cleavage system protein H [Nitrospinae bacterium RIFCSPHIGHO2_12_FULL_39_42]OGV99906.1 MAG: glycine cleavage system protein H [Nitrospinae bacterium RIFCSPHIGHO2_02_FULL_39_82]OGW04143.1 MAG: glycine cleavage system protein H [Nitrospinae bacterium RIFCSPLOWO2_02_FULL_39_110]OGW06486.1 MAG: glycine cleavage system protein H [Nitrospinae bacterium RIFCSPLOWO2_02_39_17]OGW09157.1 MAG: g